MCAKISVITLIEEVHVNGRTVESLPNWIIVEIWSTMFQTSTLNGHHCQNMVETRSSDHVLTMVETCSSDHILTMVDHGQN